MSILRVMYLAAEADPIIKVGGLGDVAGSLPAALRSLATSPGQGIDIRLVIPFHGAIRGRPYPFRLIASFTVNGHVSGPVQAQVFRTDLEGLPVYLIAGEMIPPDAPVYIDPSVDGLKFTFFSLAALEMARTLNWSPHLVHANDWHTAPAIYAISLDRTRNSFYSNTSTVIGLHNLPYLGYDVGPALAAFSLPAALDSRLPDWARHLPLPLGLLTADQIVAVSPTYAQEILTPEFSSGLHEFLLTRAESITGILNGIDVQHWNPRTDPALVVNYEASSLKDRLESKLALQREIGLPVDSNVPLLAMVTRLDDQKGVDLVPGALQLAASLPWQAVILGTGTPGLEASVHALESSFPDRVRAMIRFDASLSRRIYAGADMMLIPSRYEPCGLTQMIAMRYGCVPIARATGGLRDTIQEYSRTPDSTGFLFDEATSHALASALRRAISIFADPSEWQGLQYRGMRRDFSWKHSAAQYLELYQQLVRRKNKPKRNTAATNGPEFTSIGAIHNPKTDR